MRRLRARHPMLEGNSLRCEAHTGGNFVCRADPESLKAILQTCEEPTYVR